MNSTVLGSLPDGKCAAVCAPCPCLVHDSSDRFRRPRRKRLLMAKRLTRMMRGTRRQRRCIRQSVLTYTTLNVRWPCPRKTLPSSWQQASTSLSTTVMVVAMPICHGLVGPSTSLTGDAPCLSVTSGSLTTTSPLQNRMRCSKPAGMSGSPLCHQWRQALMRIGKTSLGSALQQTTSYPVVSGISCTTIRSLAATTCRNISAAKKRTRSLPL
mmetsp:Transcript_36490/g.72177  ORF Transcript_36490/g.72177 Transcript_36490/m.72177 type:complete len:212 (+) Transcript_36490:625-1260(+)